MLCNALSDSLEFLDYPTNSKTNAAVKHLKQKKGIKEATEAFVWGISSFLKIEYSVSLGFDLSEISQDYLLTGSVIVLVGQKKSVLLILIVGQSQLWKGL